MTTNSLSILKRVRLARGWSLRKVAELTDGRVSHEAVRQAESGLHESRPETVAAIATALGIPPDLLEIDLDSADQTSAAG